MAMNPHVQHSLLLIRELDLLVKSWLHAFWISVKSWLVLTIIYCWMEN